jgi:autoinducer 2-degrading protein
MMVFLRLVMHSAWTLCQDTDNKTLSPFYWDQKEFFMLIRITALLLASQFLVAPLSAQENPIEKEVKASLQDLKKPFVMLVTIKIKDATAEKFEAAFAKCRTATRKEKGNEAYSAVRSTKVKNEYVLYERWENFAALQAHLKTPHFVALMTEVSDMFDGAPDVKVFLPTRE